MKYYILLCCCTFDQLFLLFIRLQWSIIDDLMMANVNAALIAMVVGNNK